MTTNIEMIAFYEDDIAILEAEKREEFRPYYFIIGKTLNGARFFSENFCYDDCKKMMASYRAVVKYFGGGTVTLYENTAWDCSPVEDEVVW